MRSLLNEILPSTTISTEQLQQLATVNSVRSFGVRLSALRSWMEFTPSNLPFYRKKKQFFEYNLGKFLNHITLLSYSSIILKSFHKLYLKNCFFFFNKIVKWRGYIPSTILEHWFGCSQNLAERGHFVPHH